MFSFSSTYHSTARTICTTMNSALNFDRMRLFAGLVGLTGALLFFAGDMCFYGYFGSGDGFAAGALKTVQQDSEQRLFVGGLIGPLAACMCMIGFWHVYLNVQPHSRVLGRLMLAAFFLLMVGGSAVHTLWAAKGIAIKYCTGATPGSQRGIKCRLTCRTGLYAQDSC